MSVPIHDIFAAVPGAFTGSFGYPVTVSPGGQAARPVRAIIRAPMSELVGRAGDASPGVKGKRVPASFAQADVPGLRNGDPVVIVDGGATWLVRSPEHDGRGMVQCELERGT